MNSVHKNITITIDLDKYVTDTNLNLSRFVQDRLKERIASEGKTGKYLKDQKEN